MLRGLALASVLLLAACSVVRPDPVVRNARVFVTQEEMRRALPRVAVMPLDPSPSLAPSLEGSGETSANAAALVSRFVSEAMTAHGVNVIPASDLEMAFLATDGQPAPRRDPAAAATLAHDKFGATGVLMGKVHRVRELAGRDAPSRPRHPRPSFQR